MPTIHGLTYDLVKDLNAYTKEYSFQGKKVLIVRDFEKQQQLEQTEFDSITTVAQLKEWIRKHDARLQ